MLDKSMAVLSKIVQIQSFRDKQLNYYNLHRHIYQMLIIPAFIS